MTDTSQNLFWLVEGMHGFVRKRGAYGDIGRTHNRLPALPASGERRSPHRRSQTANKSTGGEEGARVWGWRAPTCHRSATQLTPQERSDWLAEGVPVVQLTPQERSDWLAEGVPLVQLTPQERSDWLAEGVPLVQLTPQKRGDWLAEGVPVVQLTPQKRGDWLAEGMPVMCAAKPQFAIHHVRRSESVE